MDTPVRTLEWIQHGLIQATIAQKPYTMAYTGIRMLADFHKYPSEDVELHSSKATVPTFVDTGATMVNKDNVEGFIEDQRSFQPDAAAGM
jgi:ribose transport system substrate-binding protein